MVNDTTTRAKCDANASGRTATDWGESSLPCQTRRGLRSLTDRHGVTRFYCAVEGHRANVERRFGRYVSEIADDPLGQAKARTERAIERLIESIDIEEDDEYEFDREGQPEFSGQFR